ncbi:MAG TPA: prolipoprotein diacylglyceryl transferase [Victivallales bacterium]|nr:prolipoprotein diacylglyceryl transferase [Victivallales bacterium]
MHRIFLQLGPLTITWYGVMAGIAAICSPIMLRRNKAYAGMNDDQCYDLLIYGVLSGIIGARVFYVVQFWDNFRGKFLEIFKVYHGGLVFYGGFLFAILAIYIFSRRNKLDFLRVLDLCAPALPLGHFFGRIGCFLNGCCFGKRTDSIFGVVFPKGSDPYYFYGCEVKIHPTQLYEAFGLIIIFFIFLKLFPKLKKGQPSSLYVILYALLRFSVEIFRGDHRDFIFGIFTPAQFICILIFPIAVFCYYYFGLNYKTDILQKDERK